MEDCVRVSYEDDSKKALPTDPEIMKGICSMIFCCEYKKCCKKYKKGKRCKKCPNG